MSRRTVMIRLVLLLSLPAACVEPYYPPGDAGVGHQLVVNGFIDASAHTINVSLSRAVALGEAKPIPAEENASVRVIGSNGDEFVLDEGENGIYKAKGMTIDAKATYTLHIETEGGRSYSSDEISILTSPPIDSISWRPTSIGVNFYVNTHDPKNATRYYRWNFDETWEYNVMTWTDYKKNGYLPVLRKPEEWVYTCWQSRNSTDILVNSTKKLIEDRVSMFQVYYVPKGSRKFSHFYRLTITQRAISEHEFNYWEMMKKTTENMGGLFDPLPTQVLGNLHSDDDPREPVLGYFSGGITSEKILFVKFLDLPGYLRVIDSWGFNCPGRAIPVALLYTVQPWEVYVKPMGNPVVTDWLVTHENCADCRTLGGDNKRPEGWPTK